MTGLCVRVCVALLVDFILVFTDTDGCTDGDVLLRFVVDVAFSVLEQ